MLNLDCLIVCRHVVKEDKADYYIMMTNSFLFYVERRKQNNFAINSIRGGREFRARKVTFYKRGVFIVTVGGDVGVIMNRQKSSSCPSSNKNWGMPSDTMNDLCDKIDQYFFNDVNGTSLKVEEKTKEVLIETAYNN